MPLSNEELKELGILDWNEVKKEYHNKPTLLLGNGFSISLSKNFMYSSIFNKFKETCNPKFEKLFESFNTTNFEKILEYLIYAEVVNEILEIQYAEVQEAKNGLKNGLIRVINEIHPRYSEIDTGRIEYLANNMINNFGDVFTLNYDLYMYHIIMKVKDLFDERKLPHAYQDQFYDRYGNGFNSFVKKPFSGVKRVFYLHGALFIFNRRLNNLKILRGGSDVELIDIISNEIFDNNIPLFVSEGTSEDKMMAIQSNDYLRFCLEQFNNLTNDIFVYGTSFGDNDRHIIEGIKNNGRKVFISIYVGNKTKEELLVEYYKFKEKLTSKDIVLTFINSNTVF